MSTAGLRAGLDETITHRYPTCHARNTVMIGQVMVFWVSWYFGFLGECYSGSLRLTLTDKYYDSVVIPVRLTTPGNGVAEITARMT